jgi:signal transduction histidine kinase/tetratricopeptide (TPR) repeat protein
LPAVEIRESAEELVGELFPGRYSLRELLGARRRASVWRAADLGGGPEVSIKIFTGEDGGPRFESYLAFRRQANALERISHPRVARLLGIERSPAAVVLVEEYFPGVPLSLRPSRLPLPPRVVAAILYQVVEALEPFHEIGIWHRRLTPSNILLAGPAGRPGPRDSWEVDVRIIHLGHWLFAEAGPRGDEPAEECAYTAPESAGMIPRSPDGRSDFWSLGVVAYELLSGRLPWEGATAAAYLHRAMALNPRPLASLVPGVPEGLARLLNRLIAKGPEDRPATTTALREELRRIGRMEAGDGEAMDGGRAAAPGRAPELIERETPLRRLRARFDLACAGEGGAVIVSGDPGAGKTRLVEELRPHVEASGGLFLSTRANELEKNLPFFAVREIIESYVEAVRKVPRQRRLAIIARIQAALGSLGGGLIQVVPSVRELLVNVPEKMVPLDPHRERQRFISTVIKFFLNISFAGQPLLLFFDDLHWVDAESRDIFEKLAGRLNRAHLLLVGAQRTGAEAAAGESIGQPSDPAGRPGPHKGRFEHLEVPPLTFEGTARLLRSVLALSGEKLEGLPEFAFERARGNVRFTLDIAGVLLQEPAGDPSGRSGVERLKDMEPAGASRGSFRSIDRLAAGDRETLSLAAVIGRQFSLDLLLAISGKEAAEVSRAIERGIERRLIVPSPRAPGQWHQFIDGAFREDLHGRIEPATRRAIHERIGDLLLAGGAGADKVFEIAYHHQRSGDPRKAVHASLRAGDEAKRTHASLQAARFYETALEEAAAGGVEIDRPRLLEDLGDAYALKGRYPDAERSYRAALEPAGDRPRAARLHGKIGDMHFRRGASGEAIPHFLRGLSSLGIRLPTTRGGTGLSIALRAFRLAIGKALPRRALRGERRRAAVEAVKVLHSMTWASFFLDVPRALEAHLRQVLIAGRLGPSRELAQAWCDHGFACSLIPWPRRALRFLASSLQMRHALPDPWGIGQSRCFLGIWSYYQGDHGRALEELREGIRLLERVGDLWEVESATIHVSLIHQATGDFPAALAALDTVVALGEGLDDRKFQALALIGRARVLCLRGDLDPALDSVDRALALDADHLARAVGLRVKAQVLLRHGLPEEARAALAEAAELIRRNRLRGEYVAENPVVAAEALAAGGEDLLALPRRERRRWLRRLGAAVSKAMRSARSFPSFLGPALRVRAVHRWLAGHPRAALADFARSRAVLARLGARYELGRTQLAAGRWLSRAGEPRGAAFLDEAIRIFQEIGARRDLEEARELRLAGGGAGAPGGHTSGGLRGENRRLASLFEASQSLASILELDRLLRRGVDLAIEVLGAERGFILLAGEEGQDPAVSVARDVNQRDLSPAECELNLEVLRKVHAEQKARAVTEEIPPRRPEAPRRLRSILCVPLRSKERPIGLLYVDNRLVKDLYRQPDVELLSTFGAQLAVAIENARAYRKIEELNLGLEEKVRERTAELLKAKGVLEKANQMKDEFLATMSHELRTPLNAVIALADILSEETFGTLNEKQRKYVGDIIHSGTHLLALINDILDLSKMGAGQMRLQTSTFDLNRLLAESQVMVKEKAAHHAIALSLDLDPGLGPVEADHRKVKQVVYNLLSNAVKFTPDGGRVVIRSRRTNGEVVVSVEDNGIGIAREDLGKMFQEFQQIDSSLSRKYPGTGLGLALSRKFVELHGGRIWVQSEPGKGSSFSFAIPTTQDAAGKAVERGEEPHGTAGATLDR